ncbi:hypothetical protein B0H11DRAFT_2203490 [Mycena galericulata]|nr:hypothetical protein B0H11DRAFT_2203490 [Mycena galericulata]
MPRAAQTASHQHRGTGGMFAPSQPILETEPDDNGDNLWESDTESDTEEGADYFEAWETQPKPRTYDEREERRLKKREKAAVKHRAAEMRSAENREGGAFNKNAGTGAYGVGGVSKRTVQAKKKKLRDAFKSGSLGISEAEFKRQLAAIDATEAPSAAKPAPKRAFAASESLLAPHTITNMFANQKRARAPSPDDEIIEVSPLPGASFKRLRTDPPELPTEEESSSDELGDEEEEEPVPEQVEEQAREEHGDEVVDSIVLADDVADWVDTILDDAAPQDPKELGALAAASLKTARKQKDYRSEMIGENEKMATELRLAITDSTTVIYPDNKASGDDYWNMQQMIEQLIIAILIARRMFPKAIIHWIFDNSSAHGSLAPDALTVTKMNVNPGGKVPEMRDTVIPDSNPHGHGGEVQKMTFDKNLPANHPGVEGQGSGDVTGGGTGQGKGQEEGYIVLVLIVSPTRGAILVFVGFIKCIIEVCTGNVSVRDGGAGSFRGCTVTPITRLHHPQIEVGHWVKDNRPRRYSGIRGETMLLTSAVKLKQLRRSKSIRLEYKEMGVEEDFNRPKGPTDWPAGHLKLYCSRTRTFTDREPTTEEGSDRVLTTEQYRQGTNH